MLPPVSVAGRVRPSGRPAKSTDVPGTRSARMSKTKSTLTGAVPLPTGRAVLLDSLLALYSFASESLKISTRETATTASGPDTVRPDRNPHADA
jgi:hypothetical protein